MLTGEEIIEKLKELFSSVDEFAYEQIIVPENFMPSAATLLAEVKNKEIKEKLVAHGGWNKFALQDEVYNKLYKEWTDLGYHERTKIDEFLQSINLEFVGIEQVGGEGEGEHWHKVFHFPAHDVYLKVTGYYASYDGTTFHGWQDVAVVRPEQKTITVYE